MTKDSGKYKELFHQVKDDCNQLQLQHLDLQIECDLLRSLLGSVILRASHALGQDPAAVISTEDLDEFEFTHQVSLKHGETAVHNGRPTSQGDHFTDMWRIEVEERRAPEKVSEPKPQQHRPVLGFSNGTSVSANHER